MIAWIALLLLLALILGGSGCEASESEDMPWSRGINRLFEEFTDTLPRIGAAISIAVAAALWMFGESQVTKTAMRISFGTGICLSAPSMIEALTGTNVAGCLF